MIGKHFVDKCLHTATAQQPWQHQEVMASLPQESFDKLRKSCEQFLEPSAENEMHYRLFKPQEFKEHNIDFYDEMYDLGREILKNARQLCEKYSRYRWFRQTELERTHIRDTTTALQVPHTPGRSGKDLELGHLHNAGQERGH